MRGTVLLLVASLAAVSLAVNAADVNGNTHKAIVGSPQNPVALPQLPATIKIDGDAAKWAQIPALPAPFSRKANGALKLAWRDEGLYGLLQVKDANIVTDSAAPWTKDCIELWLETDYKRSYDMTDHSYQIALAPSPTAGAGRAIVLPANGHVEREAVLAEWKPIDGGYLIEFFIPAAQIKGTFQAGTKLGFNYAVDEKGTAIEEFYSDKDMDSGFCSPATWGVVELKK